MTGGRQAASDPAGAGRRPHLVAADGGRPSRTEAAGSEAEHTGVAPARRTARPMYVRLALRRVRQAAFARLRQAGWGGVAEGPGSPGDPTDALPVPSPLTCAPQGVSGALFGWMSVGWMLVGCCSHLGLVVWRGIGSAWAPAGLGYFPLGKVKVREGLTIVIVGMHCWGMN